MKGSRMFNSVGERLRRWAEQIGDARAEAIARLTKETIRDLAGPQYFSLPSRFTGYIDEFERRESALQSIADYRDHFIHPFHVFCLGFQILRKWIRTLGEAHFPLYLTRDATLDDQLKLWFVASIYHDVGYAAEKQEVLAKDFFRGMIGCEIRTFFDWSPIMLAKDNISHIKRLGALYATRCGNGLGEEKFKVLQTKFERWFHKHLLVDHDHGSVTALMLLNQGWETEDDWQVALEAALAVTLHSYRHSCREGEEGEQEGRIDLGALAVEDLPLAFFLCYCDCAQEWGRRILLDFLKGNVGTRGGYDALLLAKLDCRLREPVPVLSLEEECDKRRVKTTVVIRYHCKPGDSLGSLHGANGREKTLKDLFDEVAHRFEATWFLRKQWEKDFWIQGEDEDGIPVGYMHPAPQGPDETGGRGEPGVGG